MIRRILLWAAIALGGIISCGLIFALWMASVDGPRPDTSDLEPVRAVVPDDQNGYAALIPAFPLVQWEDDLHVSPWDSYQKLDRAKVKSLLAKNEKPLAMLDTALGMPAFQVEQVKTFGQINNIKPMMILGHAKLLSAFNHWEKNERHRAFEDALQLTDYARKIQNGDGTLAHFLIGVTMESRAVNGLTHFVSDAQAPEREELLKAQARLKLLTDHTTPCSKTLKVEFKECSDFIDNISAGKIKLADLKKGVVNETPLWAMSSMTFQPNNTVAMFATTFRTLVNDAPLTYDKTTREPEPLATFSKLDPEWKILISPNASGKMIYMIISEMDVTIVSKKCRIETNYGMLRALIALRLYWLDHGSLPATLDDLVPAYIESVPVDAYDGKPLRYSPSRKVIYSVGKDLTDKGGDLSDDNGNGDRQPTLKIEW